MEKKPGVLRATLIGGVLYLIPVVLLVAILGKAMQISHSISPPLVHMVEAVHLGHILTPGMVAVLVLVIFCLLAGAFSRTALAKRLGGLLDDKLGGIPGYSFYRSFGEDLAGVEPAGLRTIVMVSMEDAWQIGMVVDELEDGLLAVYIPGVPEPRSGSLYFVSPDRVRALPIPTKSAMLALRRMGVGSKELLKAPR